MQGVWKEFEAGGWHAQAKESAQASGGRFVSWFDQPGRANYVTFDVEESISSAVLFIRYSRPGGTSFLDVAFGRGTKPGDAKPLALLATQPTGSESKFEWIGHPVGNLPKGTYTLVVRCTVAGGGGNLDVAGLVGDDKTGSWMPDNVVEKGVFMGTGSLLDGKRPSSVYDPSQIAIKKQAPPEKPRSPGARAPSDEPQIVQKPDEIKDPARKLKHTVTWFGNDMVTGDKSSYDSGYTPHNVNTISVTPDGTVFTNVHWEEHGANVTEFKDGQWVNDARVGNHGGGRHITATSQYIFFQGNRHRTGNGGIDRRLRADISDQGKNLHIDLKDIVGMASTGENVFVATREKESGKSAIVVFDTELKAQRTIEVPYADKLTVDSHGSLWMLQTGGDIWSVVRLTQEGQALPQKISLPEGVIPAALGADPLGRLLVADGGPSEQVLVYETIDTAPKLTQRFGEKNGVYSGVAGTYGPRRFVRLTGVGADLKGNIYTASRTSNNGATLLQAHSKEGDLLWQRACQMWIDCPDMHPDDPNLVYSSGSVMRVDWDAPVGENWKPLATTIHHRMFPEEYRSKGGGSGSTFVRKLSNGRIYQFVLKMEGKEFYVYRFDAAKHGAIAIPAGRVDEESIWVDLNGDGKESADEVTKKEREITIGFYVDSEGTIWNASHGQGIFRYPVQRFTDAGVPVYSMKNQEIYDAPEGMKDLRRAYFFPEHGRSLLVNGFTEKHPNVSHHWKRAGKVIRRFDSWEPGKWNLRWELVPAYEDRTGNNDGDGNIMSFDVAGDYLFIGREGASGDLGVRRGRIDVFRYDDASYVGWMEPEREVGHIGILDITHAIKAFKRDNGEYLVFLEEGSKARTLVYRWTP